MPGPPDGGAMKRLMVIIPDRLSELIQKGEITARYYNPGNLFDEVHILMTNNDQPDREKLQKTVGKAKLHLYNLPVPSSIRTFGWRPYFMKNWLEAGLRMAEKIQPNLIRTHGNYHNGYLAIKMKKQLGLPVVVSLHTNPDLDLRRPVPHWQVPRRILYNLLKYYEKQSLLNADRVIIVYESQRAYVIRNGARDIRLIPNAVNPDFLVPKTDYDLHSPAKLVSVGNQFAQKNPENIIRAMRHLPASLTIIGDGPYHERLKMLSQELGLDNQIEFIKSLPNDELCASLTGYDLFAVHCDSAGIPKAVIEPLLVGLPIVVNRNKVIAVPELEGDWVYTVENNELGYHQAFLELLADHKRRERLGRRAYSFARDKFLPSVNEQKIAALYQELMKA